MHPIYVFFFLIQKAEGLKIPTGNAGTEKQPTDVL